MTSFDALWQINLFFKFFKLMEIYFTKFLTNFWTIFYIKFSFNYIKYIYIYI